MHHTGHVTKQKKSKRSSPKKLLSAIKGLPAGIPKLIIPSRHIIGYDSIQLNKKSARKSK